MWQEPLFAIFGQDYKSNIDSRWGNNLVAKAVVTMWTRPVTTTSEPMRTMCQDEADFQDDDIDNGRADWAVYFHIHLQCRR